MAVSAKAVKDFLESASLIGSVSEDKLSRYLFLYEKATKTTSVLTGMPGGGGSDHETVLVSMADAKDDAGRWEIISRNQKALVSQFLKDVEIDDYYKSLLTQRYILVYGWNLIYLTLRDNMEISERKMFYDHNKALQACADWVNKSGKYKEVFK